MNFYAQFIIHCALASKLSDYYKAGADEGGGGGQGGGGVENLNENCGMLMVLVNVT